MIMLEKRGVSLVELLVVLAIASIMAALAIPSFGSFLSGQQLRLAAHTLSESLTQARLAAISRSETVVLAPVNAAWENGWQVFVDADGDGMAGPDEEILARHVPSSRLQVKLGFSLPDRDGYIAFAPSGRSCRAGAPELPRWGTLTLKGAGEKRRIKVSFLGRHRMCNPATEAPGCDGPEP
jgi:type IV fimbrial biogenesis protein FimT